ncbi:hypothetical protein [Escherichia phage EK010]|uniref:Uncharacterized protein n=1 Tax=Escherichia phage EK010 TaxID=2742112 RepID=A0A6J4EGD8_9CAUD|nr:hypothetical protein PQC42_gp014 [Escherichia phage EK010]UYE90004.1 hypothetical protein [Escherichia phage E20-1]BCG44941.1 hypothetical protein [Escherichia phage EK010]
MNIRLVREQDGRQVVLGEIIRAAHNLLPEKDETVWVDGEYRRVLSVVKSFEPKRNNEKALTCWFEVNIT